MSKGDGRRPPATPGAFETNYDRLDWKNDAIGTEPELVEPTPEDLAGIVWDHELPPREIVPNEETVAAMREARAMHSPHLEVVAEEASFVAPRVIDSALEGADLSDADFEREFGAQA